MLTGKYKNNLNESGRICIPSKMRDVFGNGLVITKSPLDKCLVIYPMERWVEFSAKIKELPHAKSKPLRRIVFGNATDVEFDIKGRFIIPVELREYAELGGEVVIMGLEDCAEIWNPVSLEAQEAKDNDEDMDKLLNDLGF